MVDSNRYNKSGNYSEAYCLCTHRSCQRTERDIQEIPARNIPVVQIRSFFPIHNYCTYDIYKNTDRRCAYKIRYYNYWNDVPDQDYPAPDNFSKQEYFNILFDFIPLCAGNSACFDSNKIFYRSRLIGLGYFDS